jgi:hypothetical protein
VPGFFPSGIRNEEIVIFATHPRKRTHRLNDTADCKRGGVGTKSKWQPGLNHVPLDTDDKTATWIAEPVNGFDRRGVFSGKGGTYSAATGNPVNDRETCDTSN